MVVHLWFFRLKRFGRSWASQIKEDFLERLVYHYLVLIDERSQFLILKELFLKPLLFLCWIQLHSFLRNNL